MVRKGRVTHPDQTIKTKLTTKETGKGISQRSKIRCRNTSIHVYISRIIKNITR